MHGTVRLGALALLLIAVLMGCRRSDELREGAEAVRAYNSALIDAYSTSDPSKMEPVATVKECRKIWALIDLKRAAGLVLENTLEETRVLAVTYPKPLEMVVETTERWRYCDRPLKPGAPAGQVFVAQMRMRYNFVKSSGGWKMDQGETLSCEYLEPIGFTPNTKPPATQPPNPSPIRGYTP